MSICAPCDGLANTEAGSSMGTLESVPNTIDDSNNPRFCKCADGYGFGYSDGRGTVAEAGQLYTSGTVAEAKCA